MSRLSTDIDNGAPSGGKADPDDVLALHQPRPRVTRLNPRVVVLGLILVGCVLSLAILIGFGGRRPADPYAGLSGENLARPSDRVAESGRVGRLPEDYTFDIDHAFAGVGYENPSPTPPEAGPPDGAASTARDAGRPDPGALLAAEENQRRLEALRREMEAALDSPLLFTGLQIASRRAAFASDGGANDEVDSALSGVPPEDRFQFGGSGRAALNLPGVGALPAGVRRNLQAEKQAFLTEGRQVEPYLQKPLLEPISAFEVKAGTVIPGALVTGINTDLPGEVVGQVTENVFDTVTGRHLLIPQGARLLGAYSSLVSNGQNRALVVWTRMIFPNGDSIVLDGMPGTDAMGQAGLRDRVDYHLDRVAAAVALTTAITYAGNLVRDTDGDGRNNRRDVIGDTIAQEGSRVGQRIVDRELDVQPTITVRPGWPLRVLVNRDMILAPYEPRGAP